MLKYIKYGDSMILLKLNLSKRDCNDGFTLTETLITTAIVVIIALAGFSFLNYCGFTLNDTHLSIMANGFARETIT